MGVSATVSVSTYAKHSVSCPICHFRCFKAQYRHLQKQEEKRKSVFQLSVAALNVARVAHLYVGYYSRGLRVRTPVSTE